MDTGGDTTCCSQQGLLLTCMTPGVCRALCWAWGEYTTARLQGLGNLGSSTWHCCGPKSPAEPVCLFDLLLSWRCLKTWSGLVPLCRERDANLCAWMSLDQPSQLFHCHSQRTQHCIPLEFLCLSGATARKPVSKILSWSKWPRKAFLEAFTEMESDTGIPTELLQTHY